jgi:two-component system LytT family response regulator
MNTDKDRLSVLIVDDEPLAREGIRSMLTEFDTEIVGEATSGKQALRAIREKRPQLVFLDVQMPEMDGFAVLEQLVADEMPYIIFVTAYDQYAVRAFEVHAIDYLLKPLDEERFRDSMRRASALIERKNGAELRVGLQALACYLSGKHLQRILVKTAGRIYFVRTDEIDWIEAQGNYVLLHSGKQSHLIRETIGSLEADLDPQIFLRIHRSAIVNIERIQELHQLFHGDYRVLLRDGTQLTLSRRYREKARERLGKNI